MRLRRRGKRVLARNEVTTLGDHPLSLRAAPLNVRRAFEKQLRILVSNLLHPSLRTKKYDEEAICQSRRRSRGWPVHVAVWHAHDRGTPQCRCQCTSAF